MNSVNPYDKIPNPFELIFDQLTRIESMLITLKDQKLSLGMQGQYAEKVKDNTIELAIRITGLKRKTIYNLVNKRLIPHAKKGRRLYFDELELEQWIKKGKRKTIQELSEDGL